MNEATSSLTRADVDLTFRRLGARKGKYPVRSIWPNIRISDCDIRAVDATHKECPASHCLLVTDTVYLDTS